jgi:hypothetical protein
MSRASAPRTDSGGLAFSCPFAPNAAVERFDQSIPVSAQHVPEKPISTPRSELYLQRVTACPCPVGTHDPGVLPCVDDRPGGQTSVSIDACLGEHQQIIEAYVTRV